jgi:hypothetical protein
MNNVMPHVVRRWSEEPPEFATYVEFRKRSSLRRILRD